MKLAKIVEKVAVKHLGKVGLWVELMDDSPWRSGAKMEASVGDIFQISRVNSDNSFDITDLGWGILPTRFRKANI